MRRLVLFDIDGTLVRGGPAKRAFEMAMRSVFGTAGRIQVHDFSGKTDPQIARELLNEAGIANHRIDAGFEALWAEYLRELKAQLPCRPMTVLPGVRSVLDHLDERQDVGVGLLTGNILEGARLKLSSVDLMDYFPVGGFGSDSEVREELTTIAVRRAARTWGVQFAPSSVVIVGDTPRDVACGRLNGSRTVAVATGRFDVESLLAAGADRALKDFSDLWGSLEALLS